MRKQIRRNLRLLAVAVSVCLLATNMEPQSQTSALPSAPAPRPLLLAQAVPTFAPPATPPGSPQTLTRQQAEDLAIKNNPQISVASLLALARKQVTREARSGQLPAIFGNITAVGAEEATRISSAALSSSQLLNHFGAGLQLDQLITDFGRTHNRVAASALMAKASDANATATREEVVLATDLAFYAALEAQATAQVAESTVAARKAVSDQVSALTNSKLKSTLDQSFAQVNLSQARLLLLDSQNQANSAMARLNELLGAASRQSYILQNDSSSLTSELPPSPDTLIGLALQQRPDLQALVLNHQADQKFGRAQHEQVLPTVSALGIIGSTPVGSKTYFAQDWYGAVGVNVHVPIFNGFLFSAEAAEADLRTRASDERARDLRNRIVRDITTAWLTASTARQRMEVTSEFVKEANTALDLAQTRYRLGLSSIVELSQAQLQQTQAQIEDANARFEYEADLAAVRFQTASQP